MTDDERKLIWARLEHMEQLARGNRWQRLLKNPLRYLSTTFYYRFWYPVFAKGWLRTAYTFFQVPIKLKLPAGTDIFLLGGKTHDSEIRLARFLLRELQPGAVFVDVGAHFGFFSLLAARLTGSGGQVLALEAAPSSYQLLQSNLAQFDQATSILCAVNDQDAEVTFYQYPTFFSEYSSLISSSPANIGHRRQEIPRPITVPGRRLDSLMADLNLYPEWVKIDVEGAEHRVIKGLTSILEHENASLKIIMEYLPGGKQTTAHREAASILYHLGFDSYSIEANGSLRPCSDIEEHLEHSRLDSDNIVFLKS